MNKEQPSPNTNELINTNPLYQNKTNKLINTHILYARTHQNKSTHHIFLSIPLSELMCADTSKMTTIPQAVHHKAFTSLSLNVNSHRLPQTCTCMLHSMLSQKGASANSSIALSVTTWTDFFICCFVMVRLGSIDSTTTHTLSHTIVQAHQKVLWCI